MILLQPIVALVSRVKNLLLYFFFELIKRNIRLCRKIDGDNQCPLLFSCGFCIALSPRKTGIRLRDFYLFLVVVLWFVYFDSKWPLICHYIESKNPREDQYSINHSFGIGLSGHFIDEYTIADINRNYITHVRDIQRHALTLPFWACSHGPIKKAAAQIVAVTGLKT